MEKIKKKTQYWRQKKEIVMDTESTGRKETRT